MRANRPPPSSKRQIKRHSRLRDIGKSERRHLHSCNRLSGKSPHRTAMGLVMTLDSKFRFDFDKANIKPEYPRNRSKGLREDLECRVGYSSV